MKQKKRLPKKQNEIPDYISKIFPLKPGVKFSDILMTGEQVLEELYLTPRRLQYYRSKRKLSYLRYFGKILYIRLEIEEAILNNIIWRRAQL